MGTLLASIVTGLAAIIGVVLGNRLSYGRTNRERIWDLRRQAYGVILSELAKVERICDTVDEYISQVGEHEYFENKVSREQVEQIGKHMTTTANKSFADDYLVLSDQFVTVYEELTQGLREGDPNEMPPEEHDRFAEAIRRNRPRLLAQARAEMAVKDWTWRLRTACDAIRNSVRR